ncbi:MAG: cytochrome P450 [Dehalococcoidia bacterium]|nr:cytochrome P450 [Dehalococcoidia bacterium]
MNPFAREVKACPYPYYAQVRNEGPVRWNPEINAWLVTSYDAVVAVLRDHVTFSSKNSVFGGPALDHPEFPSMINEDEPKHRQLRSLAASAFTPKTIDALWEPRIRMLTNELLDAVEGKAAFEVIADLAFPLPVTVIAEIIGVESERFVDFKGWSDEIAKQIGRYDAPPPPDDYEITEPRDLGPLFEYFVATVADRRENPRDDLVTRLVRAEIEGQRLTDFEVMSFLVLLMVAGNETTTNLIGTAIRGLVTHPAQVAAMRERPELISGLVEEALRWDAPIQGFYRRATRDADLAGVSIRQGDALLVLYAAANWDPAAFGCPEDFEIERGRRDHVSFGLGNHFCLGANLARLEARIALQEVIRRFDDLRPIDDFEESWRDTPFFRGMEEYSLHFRLRS